jgi:saccharopine dehydrogenase (NADP+, L-glutamate forming)
VLLALRNDAKFYLDGKVEQVPGPELMGTATPYFVYPGFAFFAYPNRDSTPYKERYDIPEAQNIIRGTLRYQGFPEFVRVLVDIDLLSEEKHDFLQPSDKPLSWAEATREILKTSSTKESDLTWAISSNTKFMDNVEKDRILEGLRWVGLFSEEPITPRRTPLDTLCASLEQKDAI